MMMIFDDGAAGSCRVKLQGSTEPAIYFLLHLHAASSLVRTPSVSQRGVTHSDSVLGNESFTWVLNLGLHA